MTNPATARIAAPVLRRPALTALLLGAAAALGFAPLDLWPITLIAFAGWIAIVHEASTLRAAMWRGWTFGVGHFTINNNWIQHAFDFQDAMPPVLGYAAPVALALYLAVYPAMAAGLAWRFASPRSVRDTTTQPGWSYVLVFAAAWIATEYLRATMFTGYAWDPLGVTWLPLIGIARLAGLVGTYALSGLAIVVAGGLLIAVRRRWWAAGGVALFLAGGFVAGIDLPMTPATPAPRPMLRVVQPNIGQDQRGSAGAAALIARLEALSGKPGSVPRLLLWPEGVIEDVPGADWLPGIAQDYPGISMRRRLAALLGPRDLLLTGGTALRLDAQGGIVRAANSVFAIDPAGRQLAQYDKAHLVPYGEYLPMRAILTPIGLSRLVPGDLDFDSGPGARTIALPGFGAIGVQICYEIIFSGEVIDRAHRPTLLFNPSNDAWFGTWGPPQHLAQARMRAIEEGLPVIRATPTGISAVIDADGRLLATIPPGKAAAIELPIPRPNAPTLFARVGNAMAAIVAALLLALAVALRRRAR